MKNSELWEQYQNYTKDLTLNSRKLAFAAGGLCWFFKDEHGTFPFVILIALLLLVVFFLFDISQHFVAAIVYRKWIRDQEKRMYEETGRIDGDYDKPVWLDRPAFACWCTKTIVLLLVYLFIVFHIASTSVC